MLESTYFFCPTCNIERKFHRDGVNHVLHLVLGILTGGLWLVSWLALTIGHYYEPWTCNSCERTHQRPTAVKK